MLYDKDTEFQRLLGYYDRVVGFLKQLRFAEEDARDLAQEVYIRVYEHMDTYRGEAKWNYLETVARRLAYNAIRDRHAAKRNGIVVPEDEMYALSDDTVVPADVAVEQKEKWQRLRNAVEQLAPSMKSCVLLYLEGCSYEEIQRRLVLSLPAVKSRLNQARKELRAKLGEDPGAFGGET